jgi:hypothetical protein
MVLASITAQSVGRVPLRATGGFSSLPIREPVLSCPAALQAAVTHKLSSLGWQANQTLFVVDWNILLLLLFLLQWFRAGHTVLNTLMKHYVTMT